MNDGSFLFIQRLYGISPCGDQDCKEYWAKHLSSHIDFSQRIPAAFPEFPEIQSENTRGYVSEKKNTASYHQSGDRLCLNKLVSSPAIQFLGDLLSQDIQRLVPP